MTLAFLLVLTACSATLQPVPVTPISTDLPTPTLRPKSTVFPTPTISKDLSPEGATAPTGEAVSTSDGLVLIPLSARISAPAGGSVLLLTLIDGSSVSVNVDAGTQIKFAGKKGAASSSTIQPQDQVVVQAVLSEDQTYRAVRIHVLPAKPEHVHRVGIVTAYTPGVSITVESTPDEDDQDEGPAPAGSTTFQISADVKILPAARADQLQVGARVTIISPHSASGETPVATGIVVHPAADSDDD
jgi:hypothetical protein